MQHYIERTWKRDGSVNRMTFKGGVDALMHRLRLRDAAGRQAVALALGKGFEIHTPLEIYRASGSDAA